MSYHASDVLTYHEVTSMAAPGLTQDGVLNRIEHPDGRVGYADSNGFVFTRLGFRSLEKIARAMCAITSKVGPQLRRLFPNDSVLHLLLDIQDALCEAAVQVWGEMADGGSITDVSDVKQSLVSDLQQIVSHYDGGA